jgi:hypothetical protein
MVHAPALAVRRHRRDRAAAPPAAPCGPEHTLAHTQVEASRAERDAARRNALDEALAPLLELAGGLRTGAQRDALAAYVIRKLHNAWNTR